MRVSDCLDYLDKITLFSTAADWDNVGLLVGNTDQELSRVLTCLTVTTEVIQEAKSLGCQLILTHHPFPFRPIGKITDASMAGSLLLELISAGISVISPHTAFDNSSFGINQMLADQLELARIRPLLIDKKTGAEVGRWGCFSKPVTLQMVCKKLTDLTKQKHFQVSFAHHDRSQTISDCAITCGSAGDLIQDVRNSGSKLWIIGELSYHRVLEAKAAGISVIVTGHHASESFAIHRLGEKLAKELGGIKHVPSSVEEDPLTWLTIDA